MESVLNVLIPLLAVTVVAGVVVGAFWLAGRGIARLEAIHLARRDKRVVAEQERTVAGTPGPKQRKFLKSCSLCGAFALTLPFRDHLDRTYCSDACMEWLVGGPRTFCESCRSETSDDVAWAGDRAEILPTVIKTFGRARRRCMTCNSVVQRVWLKVFYIPVIPLSNYRVIHRSRIEFDSRRIRGER